MAKDDWASSSSKPGPKARAIWDGIVDHLDLDAFYGGVGPKEGSRTQYLKISGPQGLLIDQIYANKTLPASTPAEVARHLQTLGSAAVISKYPELYLEKLLASHKSYVKNLNSAQELRRWAETIENLRLVGENITDESGRKEWVFDCEQAASTMTGKYREEIMRLKQRYE